MINWPFRYQLFFLGILPAVVSWAALTLNTVYTNWETLSESHHQHGQMLANQIAPSCEFAIFSGDMEPLNQLLKRSLRHSDVELIEIYDTHFHLLSRIGEIPSPQINGTEVQPIFSAPVYASIIQLDEINGAVPEQQRIGSVAITLSTETIQKARGKIIRNALWVGGATLLLTMLLVLLLSKRYISVFHTLRNAMRKISNGDFSPPREALPSSGELGELSQDLHRMAAALERNRKATLAAYDQLEQRANEAERMISERSGDTGKRS